MTERRVDKIDIETPEKKPKNKKLIIIVILLVVLLLGIGSVFIYSMVTETPMSEITAMFIKEKPDIVLPLDEFLVNVMSSQGATDKILRINIVITHHEKDSEIITSSKPMIRDITLSKLKDLRIENLLDKEIIDSFKKSVREDINFYFKDSYSIEDTITGIYITDLIVR